MAKMSDIVNDILDELRFGSGQDVQIHLQAGLVKNVSRLYRTLMTKHIWRDYVYINSYTTNADGYVDTFVDDTVNKFSNVLAVFLKGNALALPVIPAIANPDTYRRPVLVPAGGERFFCIYPKEQRDITVVSRMYQEDDFDMDDDVPFYRDILVLGVAAMLGTKAGTNQELTQSLQAQFADLVNTYRINEMQDIYQTNIHRGEYPTEWFVQ